MDSEKIKTLQQVQDAFDIVEEARTANSLTSPERLNLEIASVKLRSIERSIIRSKADELITSLTADSKALKDLAGQIIRSTEQLSHIARALEKAAQVVEAFVNVVIAAAAAGLA